jgi:hypothetical protein
MYQHIERYASESLRAVEGATPLYNFRKDFDSIARPGLTRFLDTSAELLGDAFDDERRAGYAKGYMRSLWRTLKSEQEDAEIREGVTPSSPIGEPEAPIYIPPTWNAERAAAIAADFEADAIYAEKREATMNMMRSNPLSGVAMIGDDLRENFNQVQDSLNQVSLEDRALISDRDRAEAFKRAESVRNLGGNNVDVMVAVDDFIDRTIAEKKGVPYTPRNVIPFRRKQKPLPKTLDAITVGRGHDWTDVDGLLGEMRDWVLKTSPFPNTPLAVMAAYATLSAPCGRRLYSPTGLGLNLYLAMLAGSGVGKNAPLTAIAKILHAAGLTKMHQTAKAFTISGFEQCLIDAEGTCVATADEIAENLLAKILNKKSMSAETAMKTFLMELSGQEIDSAPFALLKRSRQGTKDAPVVLEIPGASFTLIGASTPAKFYEALTGGAVSDGFLNRFLIINGDPQPERENVVEETIPVPVSVIEGLQALAAAGRVSDHDMPGAGLWSKYERKRAGWTPYARERADELGEQVRSVQRAEPPFVGLYARIKPNTLKLATLLAASRNPTEPVVDWPDIDDAAAMVLESVSTTIEGVKAHVSDSDHHARVKKIRAIVHAAGTISQSDLTRQTQEMTPNQRKDALADQGAEIEGVEIRAGERGPKSKFYRWKG